MKSRLYRKPHSYKVKKSIFRKKIFWYSISAFLFICGIFYFIYFSPFFQIKEINVSGNEKINPDNILKIIEPSIQKKLLFIDSKSIFLFNARENEENLKGNFPLIKKVAFQKKLPSVINLVLEERKPVAVFFSESHQVVLEEETEKTFLKRNIYFIDEKGIIFEQIPDFSPDLARIKNRSFSGEISLGEKIIEEEELSSIINIFSETTQNFALSIREFDIVSEEKLSVITEENWEIYFNLSKDVEWQLTKLGAVLEEKIPPEKRGDLEYIELRFGNLAPFKYRD